MNPNELLDKTDKGQEEIKSRKYKLHAKLRMLLLLVDGNHTAAALTEQATKLALSPAVLDDLREQGYISEHRAKSLSAARVTFAAATAAAAAKNHADKANERYRKARRFMNESIVNVLGTKSPVFTMRIEKTANLDDLRGLMSDYEMAISSSLSEQAAGVLVGRMKALLKI